jgi:acyl-CoA dehydrogenase
MQEDSLLSDAILQLLSGICTPQVVRAIERGTSPATLWAGIEESGFCDALVSEQAGGAGLPLSAVLPIVEACGKHAVPLPLAQTLFARWLLSLADMPIPVGSIALATWPAGATQVHVTYGAVADWVLLQHAGGWSLLESARATYRCGEQEEVDADLGWTPDAFANSSPPAPGAELRVIQACVLAGQISGAVRQVFDMTLRYANERSQFGKSIGKFQAVQHQLSVMAEHTAAAHMAASMAFSSATPLPHVLTASLAKARTSEAAGVVCAAAHAVHGAIGITGEFDLQLLTRRLQSWRGASGSASYWNARIGRALVDSAHETVLDFVRFELSGTARPHPATGSSPAT